MSEVVLPKKMMKMTMAVSHIWTHLHHKDPKIQQYAFDKGNSGFKQPNFDAFIL